MGLDIIIRNANFEENAKYLAPAVPSDLEYLNVFVSGKFDRNMVKGKPGGVVVGTPTMGDIGAIMTGKTNYVQTAVAHTGEHTLIAIAKPSAETDGFIISNYQSTRVAGGGTAGGATLRFLAGTAGDGKVQINYTNANNNAGTPEYIGQSLGVIALPGPWLFSGITSGADRTCKNWTTGSSITTAGGTNYDLGQPYRIGSSYSAIESPNLVEIAAVAIYSAAKTPQEMLLIVEQLRALLPSVDV